MTKDPEDMSDRELLEHIAAFETETPIVEKARKIVDYDPEALVEERKEKARRDSTPSEAAESDSPSPR